LNDYLSREITLHSDRLQAIADIARHIAARTEYQYKAGLWLRDFHRGLLWQIPQDSILQSPSYAPSWSWASAGSKHLAQNRLAILADSTYKSNNHATILEINIVNAGNDPYSHVLSAFLKVRARCHSGMVNVDDSTLQPLVSSPGTPEPVVKNLP
jgi:hypothetical protein